MGTWGPVSYPCKTDGMHPGAEIGLKQLMIKSRRIFSSDIDGQTFHDSAPLSMAVLEGRLMVTGVLLQKAAQLDVGVKEGPEKDGEPTLHMHGYHKSRDGDGRDVLGA